MTNQPTEADNQKEESLRHIKSARNQNILFDYACWELVYSASNKNQYLHICL